MYWTAFICAMLLLPAAYASAETLKVAPEDELDTAPIGECMSEPMRVATWAACIRPSATSLDCEYWQQEIESQCEDRER